jgi:NAD(P)H-dependent FMN reductase
MAENRSLFIPVILGTTRQGRMSEHVARFVLEEIAKREGVTTQLVDIREVLVPTNDAGQAVKNSAF